MTGKREGWVDLRLKDLEEREGERSVRVCSVCEASVRLLFVGVVRAIDVQRVVVRRRKRGQVQEKLEIDLNLISFNLDINLFRGYSVSEILPFMGSLKAMPFDPEQ